MRFGPHTDAVNEVIEFARSGRLLKRAPDDPIPAGIEVTHRPDDVKHLMYYPPGQVEVPDGYLIWFGIRQKEAGEFFCDPSAKKYKRELFDAIDEFPNLVERDLPAEFTQDPDVIAGLIAEDLGYIAHRRAVFGRKDGFHERMFRCYQCGGYPCGWWGNYPEGRMIVYFSK
jgi:hypothetical protein